MDRRRKRPKRLEDSVVLASTGRRDSDGTLSCSHSVKLNIYFPVLDHFLSEMDRRFSASNLELMKSLYACDPLSTHFLDSSLLSDLASRYSASQNLLPNECLLAKRALQGEPQTVLEVYYQLFKLQTAFPTLFQILKIALTIVVSTAQCERALARIKTHLRTTMTDQRLADISLLSIERDLTTDSTFLDNTLREFEGIDKNRTIILS